MKEPLLSQWLRKIVQEPSALSAIKDSEERIVRAYKELLSGYEIDESTLLNAVSETREYPGIITATGITFYSLCPHHFLPFYGTVDIAYEPREIITGLGKLPRLVEALSKRFQIQENLGKEIATQIESSIDPFGVLVRTRARHICVCARGPKKTNTETLCTYALGTLRKPKKQHIALSLMSHT